LKAEGCTHEKDKDKAKILIQTFFPLQPEPQGGQIDKRNSKEAETEDLIGDRLLEDKVEKAIFSSNPRKASGPRDISFLLELQLRGTRFSLELRRSEFLMSISVEFLLYYHCIYTGPVLHSNETDHHQAIQFLCCVHNHYHIPVISTLSGLAKALASSETMDSVYISEINSTWTHP
jgi:hypothetical protein